MRNRVILGLVSVILVLSLLLSPIVPLSGVVDAAPSGRYRISWEHAAVRCWYNPLGTGTDLWTHPNYDFDSEIYRTTHGMRHAGLDIVGAPGQEVTGWEVYAIANGEVVQVNLVGTDNEHVIIRHDSQDGPFFAVYGHIDTKEEVEKGSKVTRGQVIATIRDTSYLPDHLHFGININDKVEDFVFSPHNWGQTTLDTDPENIGWRDPIEYLACVERVKTILIDPGHGLFNHPTYGWIFQTTTMDGYQEDLTVVDIAIHLKNLLEADGYMVYSTRELDKGAGIGESGQPKWQEGAYTYLLAEMRTLTGDPDYEPRSDQPAAYSIPQRKDLNIRPEYSNQIRPDYFVSIHTNADAGQRSGTMTIHGAQPESEQLASRIHENLLMLLWNETRGGTHDEGLLLRPGYIVIGRNNYPSVIVEAAYHDHPGDRAKLEDPAFLEKIARGIYYGTVNPMGRGLAWLHCSQNPNGSWRDCVGITSLAALALLNAGYTEDEPTVSKAIDYILSRRSADGSFGERTYETSTAVWALVATHNPDHNDIVSDAKDWLVNAQYDEGQGADPSHPSYGGWRYGASPSDGDLSVTQFALMALDAAGLPRDSDTWAKAITFVSRCQNRPASNDQAWAHDDTRPSYDDGGFIYHPSGWSLAGGSTSYGSMTAAGIWSLRLCGVRETDARIQDALRWLANNEDGDFDRNPGFPEGRRFLYYYYMTASKALAMCFLDELAESNWYASLSVKLAELQRNDGRWQNTFSGHGSEHIAETATSFALLALQTKQPPPADLWMSIILNTNAEICVYDPQGRHACFGDVTIPGATFEIDADGRQIINLKKLEAGKYRVILKGIADGDYSLTIEGYRDGDQTFSETIEGTISKGETQEGSVLITSMVGALTAYVEEPESVTESVATATGTGMAHFTPSDGTIDDLQALPVPPDAPAGVTFPHGMFSFRVTELDYDGQTVDITIELPNPVPADTRWWKYHDGQWHDHDIPITIDGNTITITLTDGGIGDIDGIADGIITDPGGPGYPRSLPPTAGGAYPVWSVLLAAVMAGASLLLLSRRRAQI